MLRHCLQLKQWQQATTEETAMSSTGEKPKEAVRKRDREEDAEDSRYRENLSNLPG